MQCDYSGGHIPDLIQIKEAEQKGCPVDIIRKITIQAANENCGKSVMCRDGLRQLEQIITDISNGKGESGDLELIRDICEVIYQTSACELSSQTVECILSSLKEYSDEWEKHCRRKRCSASVCPLETDKKTGAGTEGTGNPGLPEERRSNTVHLRRRRSAETREGGVNS